jgi:hypothetical protein
MLRLGRTNVVKALKCNATRSEDGLADDTAHTEDANELTTALNKAIATENYQLAAALRDKLRQLSGGEAESIADWHKLGVPSWLAERAEQIGFRFPTGEAIISSKSRFAEHQDAEYEFNSDATAMQLQRCKDELPRSSFEVLMQSSSQAQALARRWPS